MKEFGNSTDLAKDRKVVSGLRRDNEHAKSISNPNSGYQNQIPYRSSGFGNYQGLPQPQTIPNAAFT
jgi:hypothetical protein